MRPLPTLACMLLVPALGCAVAPLPAYLVDPEGNPPPACPAERYVFAVASSTVDRDDAAARARAAVLRRVGSSMTASIERLSAARMVDGRASGEQSVRQVLREESAFPHAELIHVVGPVEVRDGEAHALACLDRYDALAALTGDAQAMLVRFQSGVRRADDAANRGDRMDFAGAWRDIGGAWQDLVLFRARCRSLVPGCPTEVALQAERDRLAVVAARFRSGVEFSLEVLPGAMPETSRAAIESTFHRALAELGATRPTAGSCVASAPAIRVEVEALANCGWGSLGHTCRPVYRLRAQDCAGGARTVEASLNRADLAGADGRDPARALGRAVAALDVATARAFLLESLSPMVPL